MLNNNQKQAFDRIRRFIHDEAHDCANLVQLIDMMFAKDDGIDEDCHYICCFLRPYLAARMDMGKKAMDLIYSLELREGGDADEEKLPPAPTVPEKARYH
uniref:Uncharacterized protein n=1 Tax=viral metagenome TaxID=1070528 RepID=A0A6M3ISH9_9ZZZZ